MVSWKVIFLVLSSLWKQLGPLGTTTAAQFTSKVKCARILRYGYNCYVGSSAHWSSRIDRTFGHSILLIHFHRSSQINWGSAWTKCLVCCWKVHLPPWLAMGVPGNPAAAKITNTLRVRKDKQIRRPIYTSDFAFVLSVVACDFGSQIYRKDMAYAFSLHSSWCAATA